MNERNAQRDRRPQHLHLLGNGRYAVMLTAAGSGRSDWRNIAITRWREDPVRDAWGSYILLRDEDNGTSWSSALQPCADEAPGHAVEFSDGVARIRRRQGTLESVLEVVVAAGHDAELRRITIHNRGGQPRRLSLTSYAELVLGSAAADNAHPAFSKLFVQTRRDAGRKAVLATRRHQDAGQAPVWAAHFVVIGAGQGAASVEHETDRAQFLGRGRLLRNAQAMQAGVALSGSDGCVLDPVFSLRQAVQIAAGASVQVTFWTAVADSHEGLLDMVDVLRTADVDAQIAAAVTQAEQVRQQLRLDSGMAARCRRWAGALRYADPCMRAPAATLQRARGGAPVLWAKGISGDRPICVLRVSASSQLPQVQTLLDAQQYWQHMGVASDVVLLQEAGDAGHDTLQESLQAVLESRQQALKAGNPATLGDVFVLDAGDIDAILRDGLLGAARLVLDASADSLATPAAMDAGSRPADAPATAGDSGLDRATARPAAAIIRKASPPPVPPALEMANGIGGFIDDGRAYAIQLQGGNCTPLPWVNIIANPAFGFMVSAEGGGYAWSLNSQQNSLTPWPNDPVSDSPHDVLYLRDADSGATWSATALPIRVAAATYAIEHGRGYSRFRSNVHGIESDLLQWVPPADPVKLSRLRLRNGSGRPRTISVTAYVEWSLGANGKVSAPHVITSKDAVSGAVLARNPWREHFTDRVAFLDLGGLQTSASGDRAAFLGLHGDVGDPQCLRDDGLLPGTFGAGLDPCGAVRVCVELQPDEEVELRVLLGDAGSADAARTLVAHWRGADLDASLEEVHRQWQAALEDLQVRTPERGMDLMLNGWLLYQALACRVWARTACYQASGAYGFRDQLQDVMALCLARPDVAREHLLRAAGRQFAEGDVQHWWLPPSGAGIRTRISDDRAWLAYVAAHYVEVTADCAVLDERLPFLQGPAIEPGKNDAFFQPQTAATQATLYAHCALALETAMTVGAHGLPLIGAGDWNDGLNRVGIEGRGESTWLGWFLIATIKAFAPIAAARGEQTRAARWHSYAARVAAVLDGDAGWDGQWYRRGYYDDGTVLGSATSEEGSIDVIAQSWSVMSGAADAAHSAQAMHAVAEKLVRHDDKLALLFTPPFDRTPLDPGYIKGYPPGIRENGGQYTHGAIWSIFAWAGLGDGDRAGALFDLLNPVSHADGAQAIARYKVEPYVSCADVYSVEPLTGRGGWTWYSGSAGWLYRAGVEAILGLHKRGEVLHIAPCIPAAWPGFELRYRHRDSTGQVTRHVIAVENPDHVNRGVVHVALDGNALEPAGDGARIPLARDHGEHQVRIVLGNT